MILGVRQLADRAAAPPGLAKIVRLKARRRAALANAYLRGARYSYRYGGHYGVALAYIARSLWLRPGNLGAVLGYLGRAAGELVLPRKLAC